MWWLELLGVAVFAMAWWPCGACDVDSPPCNCEHCDNTGGCPRRYDVAVSSWGDETCTGCTTGYTGTYTLSLTDPFGDPCGWSKTDAVSGLAYYYDVSGCNTTATRIIFLNITASAVGVTFRRVRTDSGVIEDHDYSTTLPGLPGPSDCLFSSLSMNYTSRTSTESLFACDGTTLTVTVTEVA